MAIKRVPEPQGKGGLGWFGKLLFAAAVVALLVKGSEYLPGASGNKICNGLKPGEAQKIIAFWKDAGAIVGHRAGVVEVNERYWPQLKNDAKVSIGIAEFCAANPDSIGVLIVRGDMNNTQLGSVVNGNWSN